MTTLRDSLTYEPSELKFGTSGLRALVTDMTDLECYINTLGFLAFAAELGHLQAGGGVVYVAGDLRHSTPRILRAVYKAVVDAGYEPVYCGLVPTPTIAYYALVKHAPCVMVTGSHIPEDRNGIKFHKADGEVLKEDEAAIKEAVAAVRANTYKLDAAAAPFDENGMLLEPPTLPEADPEAGALYRERYTAVFAPDTFAGKKIVFYQHSAVGRDSLIEILEALGAEVVPVGRSEKFIPIDTENVTPADQKYFRQLAAEHPDAFAIVSTDGDSDRPFLIDHEGTFNRGDVLGAVVADWLKADFAAYPVSSSDATDEYLQTKGVAVQHTKIGSPYIISAMQAAQQSGKQRIVGWEVNGGFMLGCDFELQGKKLTALPTRDALFPIMCAMAAAIEGNQSVKELFLTLPQRFSQAGLINNFPTEVSLQILEHFSKDNEETRRHIEQYFSPERGFGRVKEIVTLDGLRITFDNGDIAHMRPSGNAPQLRCYSVADSQERADEIVALALAEPDGIFRTIEADLKTLQG
ncbi:MAG TPA: phosphomannomutase [Candidatus Saccharimonadales bacterium]|nr:phosphomannomutase [Candidatus Saccharimonadales bacterium]